jgi:hypothetical protein
VEPGLLPRFFGRVTRQAFGDLGLHDEPAARYLTDLLTRFARTEALMTLQTLPPRRVETVADALTEIQRAWQWPSSDFDPGRERTARRHIGDFALFMTGIFRDHVERLAVTSYYHREGARAYRFVSELARAAQEPAAPLYRRLADEFERYAGALAYMQKVYFSGADLPWHAMGARLSGGDLVAG